MMSPPSGRQYLIEHGQQRAHIAEVGATLRSYSRHGIDLIDGFQEDQRASDGRGQVLAPWPNRLTGGAYSFDGKTCQAAINEVSRGTAIHGLVRWIAWSLVSYERSSVTLSCALRPQPGYVWALDLTVRYSLDDDGLSVVMRAVNPGSSRLPFGAGFHPYLTLGTPSIDPLQLCVPAEHHLELTGSERPATPVRVAGTHLDFRTPTTIGAAVLDTAFGGLIRQADGRAVARLIDAESDRDVRVWVDEAFQYLMVYTADAVGDPDRRRRAVAIEPMTCLPDSLRSGTALIELAPGESWEGTWGLATSPP
jgi:aldose 1-epimerase